MEVEEVAGTSSDLEIDESLIVEDIDDTDGESEIVGNIELKINKTEDESEIDNPSEHSHTVDVLGNDSQTTQKALGDTEIETSHAVKSECSEKDSSMLLNTQNYEYEHDDKTSKIIAKERCLMDSQLRSPRSPSRSPSQSPSSSAVASRSISSTHPSQNACSSSNMLANLASHNQENLLHKQPFLPTSFMQTLLALNNSAAATRPGLMPFMDK